MKWITRETVKANRVAGPWLLKKFIVHDALFAECQQRAATPGQS